MMLVSSGPPGVLAGKPREIVSVTPVIRNSIPKVVMKDGTLSLMVMSPIAQPISAHTASAASIAGITGSPASLARSITNGASANTWPTDRSISRQISSMISPQAMMTGVAMNCETVCRLASVMKFALANWK